MNIGIIGTGYVGLVTGACFAAKDNTVVCMDSATDKIDTLQRGVIPFSEPELATLVQSNIAQNRLTFTTSLPSVVRHAEILFIAAGTPASLDRAADMSSIDNIIAQLAHIGDMGQKVIVMKSTVPMGTTYKISQQLRHDYVASNPEFLREGRAVHDFFAPDRIVIGADNPSVATTLARLYAPFLEGDAQLFQVSILSAELSKYAANAMLAVRISFANELAHLCEAYGASFAEVKAVMGSDMRIGHQFLSCGIGYGGSCFPKDMHAIIHLARAVEQEMSICSAAQRVNDRQIDRFVHRIRNYFADGLKNKRIAVWGVAFKPGTDDTRSSPSVAIMRQLLDEKAMVVAHDPVAFAHSSGDPITQHITVATSAYDACVDADALLIHTEWDEYRDMDMARVRNMMRRPVIFDGRNLYREKSTALDGFDYFCIGEPIAAECSHTASREPT